MSKMVELRPYLNIRYLLNLSANFFYQGKDDGDPPWHHPYTLKTKPWRVQNKLPKIQRKARQWAPWADCGDKDPPMVNFTFRCYHFDLISFWLVNC